VRRIGGPLRFASFSNQAGVWLWRDWTKDNIPVKKSLSDLAVFGGTPSFTEIRSAASLSPPDAEAFFDYAKRSFDSRRLTNNGPLVQLLERRLAELHQARFCVAFCGGSWGLVLAMSCLATRGGGEIVMPSLTYRHLADIAAWAGLTPRFCEVSRETLASSVADVEDCMNERTAFILVAHPSVHLADIGGLTALATRRHVPLLFDSVEAAYASYHGSTIGSFGNAECFSMHASQLLNGFEAGYLTTNDETLASRLRKMRGFGFFGQENVEELGLNAKLNEIHAAMALVSLDDIHNRVRRNRERYHAYQEVLGPVSGIRLVPYEEAEKRAFKTILVELTDAWPLRRSQTLEIMHAENMPALPYCSPPLHLRKTGYRTARGALPVTEFISGRYVTLPNGDLLSHSDVEIVGQVLHFLQNHGASIAPRLEGR